MSHEEHTLLTALAGLRDAVLQTAVKMPLPVLEALKEPMGEANKVIRGYTPEYQQDIVDTLNAALEAPNHSITRSKF